MKIDQGHKYKELRPTLSHETWCLKTRASNYKITLWFGLSKIYFYPFRFNALKKMWLRFGLSSPVSNLRGWGSNLNCSNLVQILFGFKNKNNIKLALVSIFCLLLLHFSTVFVFVAFLFFLYLEFIKKLSNEFSWLENQMKPNLIEM